MSIRIDFAVLSVQQNLQRYLWRFPPPPKITDRKDCPDFDPHDQSTSHLTFSNDFDKIKSGRPMADSKYVNLAKNILATCRSQLQKVAET